MSVQLKPVLGPVQLVFYSVGVIIGAGVYSVIGAAVGIAHEGIWLSFVIGAFVALLTGLSYAEMTTAIGSIGLLLANFETGICLSGGIALPLTLDLFFLREQWRR